MTTTTPITEMNRENATIVGDEIRAAINAIAERHGLSILAHAGRFDGRSYSMTVELRTAQAEAAAAAQIGLPTDLIGKVFTSRGTAYRVLSIDTSRPKYPISAERVSDGRRFKFARGAATSAQ